MNTPKIQLTAEQRGNLVKGLRLLSDVAAVIPKAESCGVNCDAYRVMAADLRKQLEALRAGFGKATQ